MGQISRQYGSLCTITNDIRVKSNLVIGNAQLLLCTSPNMGPFIPISLIGIALIWVEGMRTGWCHG